MRLIGMAAQMNFDPAEVEVFFIDGAVRISETEAAIRTEMDRIGPFHLVIIDTSAAFFEGADENDNVAMLAHARRLRGLTKMPGTPTLLVNSHPVKNAFSDNLLPRGGGAFLNEMDGNLTSAKRDDLTEFHWQGKFRGPDFAPITFRLVPVTTATLVDSKGREVPTIAAEPATEAEQAHIEKTARSAEDDVLLILLSRKTHRSLRSPNCGTGFSATASRPNRGRSGWLISSVPKSLSGASGANGCSPSKARSQRKRCAMERDSAVPEWRISAVSFSVRSNPFPGPYRQAVPHRTASGKMAFKPAETLAYRWYGLRYGGGL